MDENGKPITHTCSHTHTAVVAFRVLPFSRQTRKMLHAGFHLLALLFSSFGIWITTRICRISQFLLFCVYLQLILRLCIRSKRKCGGSKPVTRSCLSSEEKLCEIRLSKSCWLHCWEWQNACVELRGKFCPCVLRLS